jgi:TolB-like protein/Flp pilus assembly protein TadD
MEGKTLSHFRVLTTLGRGAMGVVYEAEDTLLRRPVALKVLHPAFLGDPERRERFKREARMAAAISHPAIATIHEVGEHEGVIFIALELIEGQTLRQVLSAGPLPVEDAVRNASEIAEALASAHQRGIIHRDLKPENVMVRPDGHVKVLDFGLAKSVEEPHAADASDLIAAETRTRPTGEGLLAGTAPYMSPEQARGQKLDARSDLFALGVVLYEMLAGSNPFRRPTLADTVSAILMVEPPPLGQVRSEVKEPLARAVARLLAKEPEARHGSASELLADLTLDGGEEGATHQARPHRSIAVLPFTNMSPDPEQEYFGEGIAEELINALAQFEGLRVAARTSAFQFRGKGEDLRRIAHELKVETVLTGSVRKAGSRLRVTAQLVSANDGYHLWSERYDRQIEDVFAIQDEVTAAIVQALKVKLGVETRTRPAGRHRPSFDVWALYLEGRHHWNSRDLRGLHKALSCFEQASAREPSFALAHTGIAACHMVLGSMEMVPPATAFGQASDAIGRALAIDETLPEAHAALGFVRWCKWDWTAGERALRRALELDPHYVQGRCWYALLLGYGGREDEALVQISRALDLDPLSHYAHVMAGEVHRSARRFSQAVDSYRRALAINPDMAMGHLFLGVALSGAGSHAEAEAPFEMALKLSGRAPFFLACFGGARALAGHPEQARAVLEELQERSKAECVLPAPVALVYAALGDADQAFEWLERAYAERDALLKGIKVEFVLDGLRSDPRFFDLVRRIDRA